MGERRQRREVTPEFRLEAVRRATSGEKSLRQVAREIGVHENLLRSRKTGRRARGRRPSSRSLGDLKSAVEDGDLLFTGEE